MNHLRCYDNGGRTFDRYSILLPDKSALGLSFNCDSPQGFSQWCEAVPGPHHGRRVKFSALPANVRAHVTKRLRGDN